MTMTMSSPQFTSNPHGSNELMHFDANNYASFNANPCGDMDSLFRSDGGQAETALCIGAKWMILNGDHRSAYLAAATQADPIQAAVAYYNSKKADCGSSWSTAEDDDDAYRFISERIKNR